MARVTASATILDYGEKVVASRCEDAEYLIPPLLDANYNHDKKNLNVAHLMLDKVIKCHSIDSLQFR